MTTTPTTTEPKPYRDRRSAHTPAAKGGSWIRPSTRWAIYHRDDFACVYCGHVGRLTIDHVGACERGPRDNRPQNLVTCCLSCNSAKQGLSVRAWFAKLRGKGLDTDAVRRRIARARRKPIDRARGRLLASRAIE